MKSKLLKNHHSLFAVAFCHSDKSLFPPDLLIIGLVEVVREETVVKGYAVTVTSSFKLFFLQNPW